MWVIYFETAAAVYLVGGSLVIEAKGLPSRVLFKIVPMFIGLPLAFSVIAHLMGWPV